MKKRITALLTLLLLVCLAACGKSQATASDAVTSKETASETEAPAASPDAEAPEEASQASADWTILMYFCGTDLESKAGMATLNLAEIAQTNPNDRVNVVIQTGGTKEWQAEESLGLSIATDKLQRYTYDEQGFTLVHEESLQNMASARTLSNYVQWGVENYPAQKYMLVLWDHGGGSCRGLIMDEKFNNSIMSLEDLSGALAETGAHMEAIVLDTCLMASLETAQAVAPYANYLIASEEVVAGEGSAYQAWLQHLYDNPDVDGARFGRTFCDYAQQKYAEQGTEGTSNFLTFSVIDLAKIDGVTDAFAQMFTEIGALLANPEDFQDFNYFTKNCEHYTFPQMVDLIDMALRGKNHGLSKETASLVQNAVEDAVLYCVKGASRSYSHGLSFFYSPTESPYTLDHYARNSTRNAAYLAFLDAANGSWTAPSWVYEQVDRLPDLSYEDYLIEHELSMTEDGHLCLTVTNAANAVSIIDAKIYQYNEQEDNWLYLGMTENVDGDFSTGVFTDAFDGSWLSLNDFPCYVDIVQETENYTLYGIPVFYQDDENAAAMSLRGAYVYDTPLNEAAADAEPVEETDGENENTDTDATAVYPYAGQYELYGLWNNVDSSIGMPGRDVYDLSQLKGGYITPICHITNPFVSSAQNYSLGEAILIDKNLSFGITSLPAGTYAYSFVIVDVFGNEYNSETVSFDWDGQKAVFHLDEEEAAEEDGTETAQ